MGAICSRGCDNGIIREPSEPRLRSIVVDMPSSQTAYPYRITGVHRRASEYVTADTNY